MTGVIENALDLYLAGKEQKDLDGHWHPSAMYGCDRMAIYAKNQVPQSDPPTAQQLRVFEMGNLVHELTQRALIEQGLDVQTELLLVDGNNDLAGTLDQYVVFTDRAEVQEYKSMKGIAFKYLKEAKPDHVMQAATYCLMMEYLGNQVDRFRVTYLSKDDLQIKEFEFDWNMDWKIKVENKLAELKMYNRLGVLPPRLPLVRGKKNWRCVGCFWRTRCWEVDEEEGDIPNAG